MLESIFRYNAQSGTSTLKSLN